MLTIMLHYAGIMLLIAYYAENYAGIIDSSLDQFILGWYNYVYDFGGDFM